MVERDKRRRSYLQSNRALPDLPLAFSDDVIRFLWVTDSHIENGTAPARSTAMRSAVADCNSWLPNALVHTGDIGENTVANVKAGFSILKAVRRPLITVIGNHDEEEFTFGAGNPNTAAILGEDAFGMKRSPNPEPFYHSATMVSGDGTLQALCLMTDCNRYDDDPTPGDAPGNSPDHSPGDRVGFGFEPSGGYFRQYGTAQLDWIEDTLAADVTSDLVLVFNHYPTAGTTCTDIKQLADKLQADGRPAVAFYGHAHASAYTQTLTSTDTLASYTFYKAPALQESGCWLRVALHLSGSTIVFDQLDIHNFTNPGGWTIDPLFTVV